MVMWPEYCNVTCGVPQGSQLSPLVGSINKAHKSDFAPINRNKIWGGSPSWMCCYRKFCIDIILSNQVVLVNFYRTALYVQCCPVCIYWSLVILEGRFNPNLWSLIKVSGQYDCYLSLRRWLTVAPQCCVRPGLRYGTIPNPGTWQYLWNSDSLRVLVDCDMWSLHNVVYSQSAWILFSMFDLSQTTPPSSP